MAAIRHTAQQVVDYALYIEDNSFLGLLTEFEAAELSAKVEEYIASGMSGPMMIDTGMLEKLLYKFVLGEVNPLAISKFNLGFNAEAQFIVRIATKGQKVGKVTFKFAGKVSKWKLGKLDRGKLINTEFEVSASTTIVLIDGDEVTNVDFLAGTQVVNGVDQRAEINDAIGAT